MEILPIIAGIFLCWLFVSKAESCGMRSSNKSKENQKELTIEEEKKKSYQQLQQLIARHPDEKEGLIANWEEAQEIQERLRKEVFPYCDKATPVQYARWLRGYLAKGGKITHYYERDFPTSLFYFVKQDCEIMELFGSHSLHLIVPEHVTVKAVNGSFGHSELYCMKDFSCNDGVPLYADIAKLLDSFEGKGTNRYELEYVREIEDQHAQRKAREKESRIAREKAKTKKDTFLLNCNPATPIQYARWLQGYLAKGGRITHKYDFDFPTDGFFIAKQDCEAPSLYGVHAINIIVPEGITVKADYSQIGHCKIYYMKDFSYKGGVVGMYPDIEKIVSAF